MPPSPTSLPAVFRPHDLKIKATLHLEAGDGTKLVEILVDRHLPAVFAPRFLRGAAASIRDALYFDLEAPTRAMVLSYIEGLKTIRYPKGRRLDDPSEDSGWLAVDDAGRDLLDVVIAETEGAQDLDIASSAGAPPSNSMRPLTGGGSD